MTKEKRTGRPLKEPKPGTLVQIGLQVPAELKAQLQARAIENNRSLSQEIVLLLGDGLATSARKLQRELGETAGGWGYRVAMLLWQMEQPTPQTKAFRRFVTEELKALQGTVVRRMRKPGDPHPMQRADARMREIEMQEEMRTKGQGSGSVQPRQEKTP